MKEGEDGCEWRGGGGERDESGEKGEVKRDASGKEGGGEEGCEWRGGGVKRDASGEEGEVKRDASREEGE